MWVFLLAAALSVPMWAGPEMYHARRVELRKTLQNGVAVMFGATEKHAGDALTGFAQEPNFYYLTGWTEPGAALLLDPEGETLFLPRRNTEQEKWTGAKADPEKPVPGFDRIMVLDRLEEQIRSRLERYSHLYSLKGRPEWDRLIALAPLREIADLTPAVTKLRMKKSPEELALLDSAIEATIAAHREAWKRAAPGMYEYQVAAAMAAVYLDKGCERPAFSPIIGSGPNSTVLHYAKNSRRMDRGEVVVMDVGAECSGYAADITRTIPLGGGFTPRQREIYEIVLGAQKAALKACKPGVTIGRTSANSLYKVAYDYIDSHGKDRSGNSLGRYFIHGLSHHIGLEVHDVGDPATPLEPGMVISVEPGIYIPEESLGVRIEDIVVVTETGCRVMTGALPREAGEVEKALSR